jgi:dolichol-phosphate mannosyltransferase
MNNTLDNKICIILPAFNEEENIENLVNRIISLDKNYSIVVVDDSTTDKTRVILDSLNYSNLKIISRNKKLGRYAAVMKAREYSVKN